MDMRQTGPKATLIALLAALTLGQGAVAGSLAARAEADDALAALMAQLRDPGLENWQAVEEDILQHWSRSGSAAGNLLLRRGREAMEEDDAAAAYEHFSALIDHVPAFAEGYNARAMVHFQAERYGMALADIGETLARNPDHFGALSGLGFIWERMGNYAAALEAFQRALALHPHRERLQDAVERLERRLGIADI